jgi:hypothetical protein
MSKANRLKQKAEIAFVHEQNPTARVEIKREGLEVGKQVQFFMEIHPELGGINEHYGVIKETHRESVVVQVNTVALEGPEKAKILFATEVPFANIKKVLGPGVLVTARHDDKSTRTLPTAPSRSEGYETCDLGNCTSPPVRVYAVRSRNKETGMFEPPRLIAVCRSHDESYVEAKCQMRHDHGTGSEHGKHCNCTVPAHIPLIWQLGVVFDKYLVPKPETGADGTSSTFESEPAFEFCWCGLEFGHGGFHRKPRAEEDEE